MADTMPEVKLDLPSYLGPFIMGGMIAALLAGALVMQAGYYFTHFPKDRMFNKWTAGILTLNSLATWGFQCNIVWFATITSRPSEELLLATPQTIYAPLALTIISQTVSQSWFAKRSWKLCGRNQVLGAILIILILASFAAQFAALIRLLSQPGGRYIPNGTLLKYFPAVAGIEDDVHFVVKCDEAGLIIAAVTDVVITGAITWKLMTQRQGFRASTDSLIKRIVKFSISAAAVTAIVEVVTGILMIPIYYRNNHLYYICYQLPHIQGLVTIWALNLRESLTKQERNREHDFKPPTEFLRGNSGTMVVPKEIKVEQSRGTTVEMSPPSPAFNKGLEINSPIHTDTPEYASYEDSVTRLV